MNYLDAVYYAKGIGRRKEEPQQPEKEDTSFLDDALEFGKLGLTQGMILPNFLGGLATEAAGNVLQGLGNLQRNSLAGQYAPEVADLLQSLGEGATGVAETMANTGTAIPRISYKSDPTEDTPSKFINQMNSAYTGAYGNIARFLHADKVADVYGNKADELRVKEEERPAPDFTLDYLLSGLPVDFGELAGSMAAILPATYALKIPAVAGMLNPIAREMINRGMYGAAKVFSQLAPQAVRYGLTSAPLESGMEGGQTRANLLAQGYSDEEATKQSAITALKNMALLLPTNTLEGLAMFSPLARAGKLATAGQIGGRGLLNTAQQSYEEFAQEGIQNAAEGKPYSYNPFNGAENQYEAAKHTAGPAALMGLVGGGVGAYRNRNVTDEQRENEQNWNRGSQENISNNDYSNRARKQSRQSQYDNLRSWANKISGGEMSDDVFDSIVRNAKMHGIPLKIALAQATAESNGDQNVTSKAGAIGVMQLLPKTAKELGVDPYDQEQNIRGGMKYLKDMYDQFGDWNLALAAYNAGAGAVQKYGGIPNYSETQNYVAKINSFLDESPYYEGASDRSVRSEGIYYLGDNGKGEGNTWQRQNGNVSLDGAQPDLLNAIDVLGKWFYDRTGKKLVVTAGTNGKHADGEHSHAAGWKVDVNDWDGESDGYLVTADGSKGSLTEEFIKFGQSIGLGMNWEGDHIDVALDGNQWADENGNALDTPQNFGGFNPRKTANNQSSIQPSQQQQPTPPKPLFDITREDNQAQDIFKQFAEEKALNSNTNEEIDFFDGMFDADGIFQNTKENRDAIRKDYADEFISFAQSRIPTEQPQQIQPTQSAPTKSQPKIEEQKIETPPEDSLLNSDDIKGRMIKYLQSLESTPENNAFRFEIGKAWDDGNQEKVRQMLESRGVSTTPIQPDPVTKNKPPENVLPKPKEKLSGQEKLINVATKAVPVGNKHVKARKKQGKALMELATQNNIEIPQPEMIALQNGSTKAVQKWRDELLKRGLSSAPQAQETSQQENSQMQTPQENSVSAKILQARKARTEQENKARAIANNLLNMSEADESFVKRESPKQSKTPYESWEDLSELSREHDITGTSYEKELQQRQAEEERQRQWKAKQDRELAELKARQAENKRLAEMRHKMDEEKVAQQAAEEKQRQVENIQSTLGSQDTALQRQTAFALSEPSANKQEREKQGNALLNLLERPQIKYAVSDSRIVNSLKPSLKVGAKPAILKAQEILNGIEAPEQQIKDELQLEDETQESRISRSEDLEDLFNEQNQQETQQPLTQEEIDKRLSQLGQISQEEADEYLNGITKQVQPQPQSQAPEENSAPQVQEQPQQEDIVKKLVEPARLTLGEAHGAKLEKILRDAQKEFSRILEADKYPEVKLAVDFSLQGAWAGMGATDNADVLKASIEREAAQLKKQRNADSFPDFVLANVVGSINDKAKQDVAWKVVKRFESGELTFEEAYKEAKHAIEIGDQSQESTTKGKTAEVLTDNRAKYPVTYKVIEADDLNVSHLIDETGNVRTNITFPAELQPRDRNRAGYRDTVLNRANNLDPKQLGESENVNQGAPVTRSDGVVLNGNGRIMAIRRAYDIGKGDNYKNSLIQNAEKYGLNSEKIAAMKNPVLVRELGETLSAEDVENIIGSKQGGEKLLPLDNKETTANEQRELVESNEQRINQRAKELLDTLAKGNDIFIPSFETKGQLKTDIRTNKDGSAKVRVVGRFPDERARNWFGVGIFPWKRYFGERTGVKVLQNGDFQFGDIEDALVFRKALDTFLNMPNEEKRQFSNDKKEEPSKVAKTPIDNNDKELAVNEQQESGESTQLDDGYRNGESEVRPEISETAREERRVENSGRDSGQQRQDAQKSGENTNRTNAENERPIQENGAGKTSTRTGEGTSIRGDSRTIQSDEQDGRPVHDDGRGQSGIHETAKTVKHETAGHNFHITKEHGIGEGGLKTKFKQNIDAIKLLKQIESEGRMATPSEQEILAKFNGWGTVASVFSNDPKWQKEQKQLKEILTPEEYEAASAAQTNAFYTSPEVAEAIWQGVTRMGFKGGRILDPSTGSGIFFGTMPVELAPKSTLIGTELDSLTGRIAKQLYQKADIEITGYQKRVLPNNYFDLAISNVPFANVSILEDPAYRKDAFALHDYFFAKSMDKVRPGGLVVFITSTGTLNSDVAKLYAKLDKQADLVAAFKLPSNTFDKNAGTQVTTDVVIFQKRLAPHKRAEYAQEWGSTQYRDYDIDGIKHWFQLNRYFVERPEHMIGEPIEDTLYSRGGRLALDGKGHDVVKELSNLMNKLPENIFTPIKNAVPIPNKIVLTAPSTQKGGTFTAQDGKIFQKQGEKLVEITGKNVAPARDYIHLLGTLDALLKSQLDPNATEEKVNELRKLLNQKYDDFVKKHGYINSPTNANRFIADPNYGRLAAIENYKPARKKGEKELASKAAIFSKRTVEPNKVPSSANTAVDALSLSLAMRGQVDMDYISDLTGKSEPEIVKELGDLIYRNPATNLHELSEEYLSGNVREKLAEAKEAARTNPEYKRNVAALEKVQPADLTEHDIAPHLGAPWIKPEYYKDFIENILNHNVYGVAVNYSPTTGEWTVEGRTTYDSEHYKWQVSGTKWNFLSLLEAAMNKKSPTVTKDKEIDEAKTNEAREKIAQLKEEFKKWIWADEARKKDLLETYNVEFNSEILRDYENGASLTFPGLAQDVKEKLYPHQRNVIWRILQGKNTLIAHTVGAGKTWSMQIAAMEMKRLGIIKKPLFVVPTNILKQFEREFRAAYPSANLLTLTAADLVAPKVDISFDEKLDTTGRSKTQKSAVKTNEKESLYQRQERLLARRKALSKIATDDWDGIIISHDMFLRLPMSPETYNEFYREQKALLEEEKRNQYGDKAGDKKHTKLLENAIASLEQKLARDINEEKKEIVMPFEELGIDQIFVDEADMFKNLGFNTHYNSSRGERVSGISTTNAQRSLDMYIKTKWLSKIRNGGGVVFATGTPISNTLNEIYTMQRYLDYFMLQDKKIYQFDNWAGMFAEEVKSTEADPSGNGFREVTRLKLTNLQTLIGMFRKFADIKMAEDLPHLTRPNLKNDSRTVVQIESTNAFKDFKKELLVRANAIRDGHIDPREDNYLKIVSDFRKASLDMRLIDPSISESEAGGKIDAICSAVVAKYKETANVKGAQLIFSDLSVPKSKDENAEEISDEQAALEEGTTLDDISVYERIKKGLIKRGIPANQIAFVHEAKNANQRQSLFDRVNNGDVRVIIGSTSKMGAGTNFQKHLVALHHLDCPWRPRDIEQREGRILRSGNDNKEVEIFTYVTKGSYDANMWEKVSIKQSMIDAVLRGDPNIKELEDVSEMSASYEDIASTAYENPLMSEEAKLSAQLRRLRYSKNLFAQQQRQKNSEQKNLTKQIPQIEKQIADLNADIALKTDTKGDAFKMKIGGTTYTKRAEAAKAFDELIQNFSKESSTKVGEIGGFDIKMRVEHTMAARGGALETISTRVFVQLANNGIYSAEDSLKSIEHFISHGGIETALKYAEKNLKATKAKLDAVNEELAKPFSRQAELDETEKRLQEVRAQISAANSDSAESETPTEQSEEELPSKESNSKEKDDWFKRHVIIARVPNNESKSSQQGSEVDTTIKNYVDPKDLTPQQKLLQDFGRKLGTRVIFFNNGDGRFHGQHSNGITYLNVDSNMPLGKVFWHESMHWLKANNTKLYQQLAKAAGITEEQRQAYLNRTERNDLPTDEAIDEEIIADQFEDVAKRSGLLQSISGKNRGLIRRVIQWLQDTMKKFVDYFRNPQGKLTTAQAQALTDEFGKIANGLVDSSGEKIFRYNRRTHNIELADGRDWDSSAEHSDNRGAFSLQPKYSIDASDNSNESTLQRIRNKITAFIGSSDAPSKRRNKRITQFLEKLADIRILTGHIKGAKNIDVDEFHRLLKSKKAYDWENILPEIGGMLAKSLNLNDSQEMRNYFTDWLLTGAPNNNSAEAKAFQQAARNNPAIFEILQNIRNEFDEIQNLSAEEFYGEKIIDKPPEKTLAEHLGYYKDNWREEFIDDLRPIERMFEQVVEKAEKTNPKFAKWLKETVNPYEMARLLRGIDSVAEIMIGETGTSPSKRINEIRTSLAQAFPNVNFSRFKPIAMILEEIGALNDKKTRRAFESYCVAKLDKEMHEKKKGDPEKYGYLQPLGTEEQADAMIAKYEKQFGQAQKDLVLYSNTMLTIMYDAGVLTKNKYSEILHSWKNYIPTARVFDENEEYDFVDSFKQKTGSNRDVWSPLQKMIANTTSLIKQAERNKVKCQIAQLARCGQFGQIIAVTENANPNPDTDVAFYEYGKKYWLNTPDPSIVRALSAIQSQKDGAWIVKAFNLVMSVFKSMMTNRNLDFAAGNVFRDSAAAYIHNKHLGYANPFMFFADVARIGFKGFWTKDANWIEWKAMGGSQSSYVSEDVDYVQRSISDLTETGLESFKKHPFSYILDRLQYIAEASETATRLTTYVKARDALAAQRSDGKATLDDKRHAALASRNATIDFAKAGTSTRKANRVFAFANAAVQDFALQFQTFSPAKIQKAMKGDKQAQQQIFSAGFRLLAMGVIPTLIQFALMHRDDDKKKIYSDLHDWEKETYWYFGDLVHIPKSMDIGIRLTSAITDEFLKTAIDKDPAEWRRFRRLILDAAPGLTATLFTPLIEAYANYSLFRDAPIVPAKEQHLPGHLQYGYDTSSVAKIISDNTIPIAKIFGAETGFSPRKIDYLINGYLGFMGRFFSHIPNYAGRGGISLDEIPIARRFLYEPYRNPKIVKDYYEALDEQASLYNGYKLELQQGKKVKPPEDFDPALYQRLKVAQESMRKLSNLEKRIQEDEKLSDNQRKEKLRELELRRVALCEKVFNKAR